MLKNSDLLREADELWYHLLMAGDVVKLKQYALLNIDFLMTIVKTASISYLRNIIDLIRSQVLDFEIELVYNMTKQSIQVVSSDPNQLASEVLLWMRPFCSQPMPLFGRGSVCESERTWDGGSPGEAPHEPLIDTLVKETVRWCLDLTNPFLIPYNSWLSLPLPPQIAMITCPWPSITRAVVTPDSQHVVAAHRNALYFYHLPAKTLHNSQACHAGTITCLFLSDSGRYLATGSDDTNVKIWHISPQSYDFRLKHELK